jgi:hypothetical protein
MADQLNSAKRANQIEGIDQVRYLRKDVAADIFGLPVDKVIYFAVAAGAVCQLPKITLIHRKKMEGYT